MSFKLGKLPARAGAVKLKLRDYVNLSQLPTPPAEFGHEDLVTSPWGMLGNDEFGDCVWAGAGHETMLWNAEAGRKVTFSTDDCLSAYSAVTGFNRDDPGSDQGTDVQMAAAYRQKTGLVDSNGSVHKVGAYLAISPGNLEEHLVAAYLFGAVGVGVMLPESAMDQFNNGDPWTIVPGSPVDGGHYVPLMASRHGMLMFSTWAKLQPVADSFFIQCNDESIAYISPEVLKNGKSLEGLDWDHLQADLAALQS